MKERNRSHVYEKGRTAGKLRDSIKSQHLNCLNKGKDITD